MNKKNQVSCSAAGGNRKKKKVIMEAVFSVETQTNKTLEDYCDEWGSVDIGGFEIIVNGKLIPFDFESYTVSPENPENNCAHVYIYSNYSGFGAKIHDVDPVHADDWAEVGLTPADITAELLASAEELTDFYFDLCDMHEKSIDHILEVKSMTFENEHGKRFSIKKEVLQRYNFKRRQEQECERSNDHEK